MSTSVSKKRHVNVQEESITGMSMSECNGIDAFQASLAFKARILR